LPTVNIYSSNGFGEVNSFNAYPSDSSPTIVGYGVSSIATGDLNGDGIPDIIASVSLNSLTYLDAYSGANIFGFTKPQLLAQPFSKAISSGYPVAAIPVGGGNPGAVQAVSVVNANTSQFVETGVEAPVLQWPSGSVEDLTPYLSWSAAPGASSYLVTLTDVTDPAHPISTTWSALSNDWRIPTPLTRGHNYTWQVIAVGPGGAMSNGGLSKGSLTFSISANGPAVTLSQIAAEYGFYSTGDFDLSYHNLNAEWILDRTGQWYALFSDGTLKKWNGMIKGSDSFTVVTGISLGAAIYTNPNLLLEADVSQFLTAADLTQLGALEQQYDFVPSTNYWTNFDGVNERWIKSDTGVWYIIEPNGNIVTSDFATTIASVNPLVWDDPSQLTGAAPFTPALTATTPAQLGALRTQYGFFYAGSFDYSAFGDQEKWFQGTNPKTGVTSWYAIYSGGGIWQWDPTQKNPFTLIAVVDVAVYQSPNLLLGADPRLALNTTVPSLPISQQLSASQQLTTTTLFALIGLQEQYSFVPVTPPQALQSQVDSANNFNEKWLQDRHDNYWFITDDGMLMEYQGSSTSFANRTQLPVAVWDDLTLLTEAQ
jgi:hypothetical protein